MRTALALGLVVAAACVDDRARPGAACPSWEAEIETALAPCAACHGGAAPAGGYALTSYLGALGGGGDAEANAIAGDAGSRLLAVLDPATAEGPHAGQAALRALLQRHEGHRRLRRQTQATRAGIRGQPEFHLAAGGGVAPVAGQDEALL